MTQRDQHEPLRAVAGDTPEGAAVMNLVNLWRQTYAAAEAMAGRGSPETIDPDSISRAVTAGAVLAGMYFGNAIIGGLATDQDRRRSTEAFARNFRTGIEIGKRQGLRVVAGMPVGGRA